MSFLLPPKDRRGGLTFFIFPKMAYGIRMTVSALLFAAGLAIQLYSYRIGLGALFVAAASLLVLMRGFNNKPRPTVEATDDDWESVGLDRFDQVNELIRDSVRWDKDFLDITCWRGFGGFLLIQIAIIAGAIALEIYYLNFLLTIFVVDAEILLLPQWFSGVRTVWNPNDLLIKTDCIKEAAGLIKKDGRSGDMEIQPMMQMARGEAGKYPVDAKMLVIPKNKPDDFIGLQVQISLNTVQGTYYPYFYCVLLSRDELDMKKKLGDPDAPGGMLIEWPEGGEVDVMVLRAITTAGGYNTKPKKRQALMRQALGYADRLCGAGV